MRLTLRTLLAYLDDRLSPANAREIGQKIARSPFATELIERIKDVVRRRRLAAPDKPVPMIDPNLVAEYLDDQLTPELVARIEREILQSDASLAEVAATHQTLGLLRDPVALEPRLRDRLYALDPSGKLEVVQTLAGGGTAATSVQPVQSAPEWQPLANRTQSSGRLRFAIVAGLALLWAVVLLTDSDLFSGKSAEPVVAQNDQNNIPEAADAGPAASEPESKTAADAGTETLNADAASGNADVDAKAPPGETVAAADSSAVPGQPTDTTTTAKTEAATAGKSPADMVAANDAAAAAASPETAAVPSSESAAEAPSEVAAADVVVPPEEERLVYPVYLTDEFQISLLLKEGGNDWRRAFVRAGSGVTADQLSLRDWRDLIQSHWLGIPQSFRVQLALNGSGWRCLIPGPTILQVVNRPTAGLTIAQGQVLISRETAADIADDAPVPFTLQAGESSTPLMLMTPDTRFAVEVIQEPAPPTAALATDDEAAVPPSRVRLFPTNADHQIRLFVVQGRVQISSGDDQPPTELLKSQALAWKVLNTGEIADAALVATNPQNALPEWIFQAETEMIPERKDVLAQVAAGVASNDSLAACVQTLAQSRNPQVGVVSLGVASLIRDVETLMTVLMDSPEELVRRAAINGLSAISQESPAGADRVRRSLETRLPMNEVPVIFKLISGISDQDARNPVVCSELLALLSSDRAATRELAFYRMESLAQDRFGYHVDSDPGRRREAVRRWQRHLDRNDGKLLP